MEEREAFVRWEEVVVSSEKGRRVVHYYLVDAGGGRNLAVVGRERSVRHMSYAVPDGSLLEKPLNLPASSPSSSSPSANVSLKWKTRREVIEWLSSLVSDSTSYGAPMTDRFSEDEEADPKDTLTCKVLSSGKMGHSSKDFSWLGSAWNCKKRRKYYRSFCRNGISISVHDFVYVMAEDNKRLIAYVEDLYEDSRANNIVVVRWFHKVDEVGVVLPPDVNDREIFFSLCLQHFSVECIDGLAAVLSLHDFEKFLIEARQSIWEPYICRWMINNNDEIKPFDISRVQGYWSQELLRSLYTPSLKLRLKISCSGSILVGNGNSQATRLAPKKKATLGNEKEVVGGLPKGKSLTFGNKSDKHGKKTFTSPPLLRKELLRQKLQQQHLAPGCQVEVLSQDSGMRGCWFRCTILKRHCYNVKVRYQDVQDADGAGNLEEWISASRVAAHDKLEIRFFGRPIVRPNPSHRGSDCFEVGTVVDAWWHDGWWEGVVILKESEGKAHVYFPGEERVSTIDGDDLRHSQDWVGDKWKDIKVRHDIASSLLSLVNKNQSLSSDGCNQQLQPPASIMLPLDAELHTESSPEGKSSVEWEGGGGVGHHPSNLVEVCELGGLKWSQLGKRKRKGHKRLKELLMPKSRLVDHENFKIGGGDHPSPLFRVPMVMSR